MFSSRPSRVTVRHLFAFAVFVCAASGDAPVAAAELIVQPPVIELHGPFAAQKGILFTLGEGKTGGIVII